MKLPSLGASKREHRHLTVTEARIVAALADTMFPEGGAYPAGATTAGVVEWVDGYLGQLPPQQRMATRSMFVMFEAEFAVFNPGSSNRFSTATAEERAERLAAWEDSETYGRRAAFQALKATMLLAYLGHPEVKRQLGITRGEAALRQLARDHGEE